MHSRLVQHYEGELSPAGSCFACDVVLSNLEKESVSWSDLKQEMGIGEVRIIDPTTGGQKGSKIEQLGFVDPLALLCLAEVAGKGAVKYDKFNYLKGYDWSLSFNAMMRHALAFWKGDTYDEETGCNHAAMAAWHGLALTSFSERGLGNDDRYKQP